MIASSNLWRLCENRVKGTDLFVGVLLEQKPVDVWVFVRILNQFICECFIRTGTSLFVGAESSVKDWNQFIWEYSVETSTSLVASVRSDLCVGYLEVFGQNRNQFICGSSVRTGTNSWVEDILELLLCWRLLPIRCVRIGRTRLKCQSKSTFWLEISKSVSKKTASLFLQ